MRHSVYVYEDDEEELALECMNRMLKNKPVSLSVRRFIGSISEQKSNYFLVDEKWKHDRAD